MTVRTSHHKANLSFFWHLFIKTIDNYELFIAYINIGVGGCGGILNNLVIHFVGSSPQHLCLHKTIEQWRKSVFCVFLCLRPLLSCDCPPPFLSAAVTG